MTDRRGRPSARPVARSGCRADPGPSWAHVARRTVREFARDRGPDLAASLTHYALLAALTGAITLSAFVRLVGHGDTVTDVVHGVGDAGPGSVGATLRPLLGAVDRAAPAGLAFTAGLLGVLWSSSAYVTSVGRAVNDVYEVGEGRPFWALRPRMLLVGAVLLALTSLVAAAVVVTGPVARAVGEAVGLDPATVVLWDLLKWPVVLGVVAVEVALLHQATPNVDQPRFRWLTPGTGLAVLLWVGASTVAGLYAANLHRPDHVYGWLGALVVLVLWLWATNVGLLLGAELDAELERVRELRAGIAAERSLQLPPRDVRSLRRARAQREDDVERSRSLHRRYGLGRPSDR